MSARAETTALRGKYGVQFLFDPFAERVLALSKSLELPHGRPWEGLPRDEQQKVSLAIAVMHSPPFLILEEDAMDEGKSLRKKWVLHVWYRRLP